MTAKAMSNVVSFPFPAPPSGPTGQPCPVMRHATTIDMAALMIARRLDGRDTTAEDLLAAGFTRREIEDYGDDATCWCHLLWDDARNP